MTGAGRVRPRSGRPRAVGLELLQATEQAAVLGEVGDRLHGAHLSKNLGGLLVQEPCASDGQTRGARFVDRRNPELSVLILARLATLPEDRASAELWMLRDALTNAQVRRATEALLALVAEAAESVGAMAATQMLLDALPMITDGAASRPAIPGPTAARSWETVMTARS
jgi:hypothetical protein